MTQAHTPPDLTSDGKKNFDPRDFRQALGCFGTGVTIITTVAPDGRNVGLTANSFSSVSLNPPLILWSLVNHSPSMQAFQDCSHFCVNVLNKEQSGIALHFARPSDDKFAGIDWLAGLGNSPKIEGALAHFECKNSYRYYGGDHVIFLGEVEAYSHHQGEPLIFSRGAFGSFQPA